MSGRIRFERAQIAIGIAHRCKHLARMRAENAIQLSAHAVDMRAKQRANVGFLRGVARCERICENAVGKAEEKLPCR
jgi:hypothetical protein